MKPALALAAFFSLAFAQPSFANSGTACQPESIIAELDRRDPAGTAQILREAGDVKNAEAMLWRLERDGIAASYLFGTVHVGDNSLTRLSVKTLTALRAAKVVALESVELSSKMLPYVMAQAGPLMAARDKPLQSALDEDELKVVEQSVRGAGYPAELTLGIQPWVASMFLTGANCSTSGGSGLVKPLDLLVTDEAVRNGVEVVGLEHLLEQFESIAAIEPRAQIAWLKASIATHDRSADIMHTMAELYRFRRINAVWQLTRALAVNIDLTDADLAAVRRGLVGQRNPRLIARSLPLLDAGGAFIAVGALHLSDEDGLVEAYRKHGYIVTAIE